MPFAPPPPPPPPGPPPPPTGPPPAVTSASDPNQRNQLLQSIRKGTSLKKTVTNDRSAPAVSGGKSGSSGGSGPPSLGSPSSGGSPKSIGSGSATLGRSNALAGLFAGGMPKLKPTGLDIGQSNSNQSQSLTSLPVANASSLHTKMENTRRQLSVDVKNRGPPPQPPPANQKPTMPQSASDSVLTGQSAVGGRSHSTTSLNQQAPTSNGWSSTQLPRKAPVGGYGKPHVAPKPPQATSGSPQVANGGSLKPCPPPKRPTAGMVARAHSMRAPKSPPIAPLQTAPAFPSPSSPASRVALPPPSSELNHIGAPPPFHQSQDSLMQTPPPPRVWPSSGRSLGGVANGPSGRSLAGGVASRPMQRPPPPPPSRVGGAPAPPPPPPGAPPPPPPPHRVASDSSLMSNGGQPPPPPTRNSSIRNGMPPICADLEARFAEMFHHPNEFPPPPPFRNLPKSYNSKSVSSKQQAPQPPTHIQLGNRLWARDNTSTC